MRLLTGISIASLVVSIAAVVFVLRLYAELDKSEPETPVVKKVHTQELTEFMVAKVIEEHAAGLIKSAGITEDSQYETNEVWESLPGFNCIWHRWIYDRSVTHIPDVREAGEDMTYNYDRQDDIWLVTTYDYYGNCEEVTTWAIDDNTGEVTYGHPDEK